MDLELRSKRKKKSIKRLRKSFKYAVDGLISAFKYEQNLTVHIITTIGVVILGFCLNISPLEWLVLLLIVGLVIATELINTSIEAIVDLISPNKSELARLSKDTAAAAVLIFAIVATIIGLIIFIPKIYMLFC